MALRGRGLLYQEKGFQVGQDELDQYQQIEILHPSVSTSFFGTVNGGTASTNAALTLVNRLAPYPRNPFYTIIGVSGGTFGGTFIANWVDQFGSTVQETVVVASAAPAVGVYGTAIVEKFISGTFQSQGSSGGSAGTAQVGFGTASNGSAQSNWFGLLTKIGGTSDIKNIAWDNNGTATGLNAGTAIGTLVGYQGNGSLPNSAFQGTSGVAITDGYVVLVKTTYDSTRQQGTMSGL